MQYNGKIFTASIFTIILKVTIVQIWNKSKQNNYELICFVIFNKLIFQLILSWETQGRKRRMFMMKRLCRTDLSEYFVVFKFQKCLNDSINLLSPIPCIVSKWFYEGVIDSFITFFETLRNFLKKILPYLSHFTNIFLRVLEQLDWKDSFSSLKSY